MSDVEAVKVKIRGDIRDILEKLETAHPGIVKNGLAVALGSDESANIAAFIGAGAGSCISMLGIGGLGVAGYSAAGITSGLAAAGSIVGGGMLAGVGVLAAVPAGLGFLGYKWVKSVKRENLIRDLTAAINRLSGIETFLKTSDDCAELEGEIFHVQKLVKGLSDVRRPLTQQGFRS